MRDGKMAMPEGKGRKLSGSGRRKQLRDDRSVLASIMKAVFEWIMEAEMEERLGAAKSERTAGRAGYRSGYYTRKLATRVGTRAVQIALGVGWDGRCEVLGVELANRESGVSWRDFLRGLRERGLGKVRYVVSDDHKGLREAVPEELPEAVWQRCFAHFVRNARDKLPGSRRQDMERKSACMDGLNLVQERGSLEEARDELAAW